MIIFLNIFTQLVVNTNKKDALRQHWSFKTGYHQKGAEKFLAGGGEYPGVEIIGRYHAPVLWKVDCFKTDNPKAIYEHTNSRTTKLQTTPVFTDEEAAPIVASVYG